MRMRVLTSQLRTLAQGRWLSPEALTGAAGFLVTLRPSSVLKGGDDALSRSKDFLLWRS